MLYTSIYITCLFSCHCNRVNRCLMLGCITATYLTKFIATHVRNDLIKKLLFAKVGYERR